MNDEQNAAYQQVHSTWDSLIAAERDCESCEGELKDTVAELREVESRLAELPKTTFLDCWRAAIATRRAAG